MWTLTIFDDSMNYTIKNWVKKKKWIQLKNKQRNKLLYGFYIMY